MSITAGRFGKRLRQLRKARGLSQIEMAHQFGIDRGHISEMESGKKNVCLPMLEVLAQGFRVTISELMKGVWKKLTLRDLSRSMSADKACLWVASPLKPWSFSLWSKRDTALTSAGDCSKPVALPRTPLACHQARDSKAIARAAPVTPEPQKT
jgi:transcriptional regulator with XRE-family HTH domain